MAGWRSLFVAFWTRLSTSVPIIQGCVDLLDIATATVGPRDIATGTVTGYDIATATVGCYEEACP